MWKAARQCNLIDWSGKIVDRTALESTWVTDLAVVATAAAAGNIATAATQSRAGDTDTAPENSQTPTQDTDPAVAATAAASSELTNSSLLAFPLENAPTAGIRNYAEPGSVALVVDNDIELYDISSSPERLRGSWQRRVE